MKQKIKLWELWGFAVTSIVGTLLHFLYGWLGEAVWIAPVSGVNESTWEHMKLIFWPMLLFAIVQSFFFRDQKNFWCIKLRGIFYALSLIPILFYTYNGVVGKSPDWLNIAIFFISAAAAYIYEARMLYKNEIVCKKPKLAIAALAIIAALFVAFTFLTPELAIFKDPISGSYGI